MGEATIIKSPLDNDVYKFRMMQGIFHQFSTTKGTYEFKCRTPLTLTKQAKDEIVDRMKVEIKNLQNLTFTKEDVQILKDLKYFKEDYLTYMLDRPVIEGPISIERNEDEGLFDLAYEGLCLKRILAEVPLLAITSEIALDVIHRAYNPNNFNETVLQKAIDDRLEFAISHPMFTFTDFGTRRRFSLQHHENIIEQFVDAYRKHKTKALIGTSNVYLANKHNITCMGTQAHEWFLMMQALTNLSNFQRFGLQAWADEYRGDLGIALSDSVGMDQFLKDFDKYFAKLFDGARHDSGCPYLWANKLLNQYEEFKINAKDKHAIFSNGLTFESGSKLQESFRDKIIVGLGIGTYFTNNVSSSIKPLQIVIKMTSCNGQPVAKLPDDVGKQMCKNENYTGLLSTIFNR